jgi:citrate synthase
MSDELRKGLEGVLVAESELSYIDGDAGKLVYRGYTIDDLARDAGFEEVLYLLWHGHLPDREELGTFDERMSAERELDDEVLALVENLAAADEDPMAALRTAVSTLSAYDPDAGAEPTDRESNLRKGRRITAKIPTITAAFTRLRDGQEPVAPREDLTHAENFLYMLNGEEPDDVLAETFDMALVLHADHGLNASTFSAMVVSSTVADLHSAIPAGIGALSGSLHGGANQDVMEALLELDESGKEPVSWVEDKLDAGERIPGFGHRVYDVRDPRARILSDRSKTLGEAAGSLKWFEYSTEIEEWMAENRDIAPNVDFYSASTYYQMGIPVDIYTPIFAMSRVGGWIAHVLEQYDDNRLIRPRGRYIGPEDQGFVPLNER